MESITQAFNEEHTLHELRHYLPAQAPLKDFIHHNTLHAFQNLKWEEALNKAAEIFGYRVSLSLHEYRQLYKKGTIRKDVLELVVLEAKGKDHQEWMHKVLVEKKETPLDARVGRLRSTWKTYYNFDLELEVQPLLFRLLCNFLDQGISIWNYPTYSLGFLDSVRELQKNSFVGIFKSKRVINWLKNRDYSIENLLHLLTGDPVLYEAYLFDQQFSHQGWSGLVCQLEDFPETLLDRRKISLSDLIKLELLLEIDALDVKYNQNWSPLSAKLESYPIPLFSKVPNTEFREILHLWQKAYEWSHYDEVLFALSGPKHEPDPLQEKTFQAMFCIDDRECSFRRYLEKFDSKCETYASPGFFGVEFYYQPEHGKFHTKLCPAPVTPGYLIKGVERKSKRKKDAHFNKQSHSLISGFLISQTLGFWSALRLFINIFKPSLSPATTSSFRHMDKFSKLTYQNFNPHFKGGDLQIGFTVEEMADRVENVLRSIGLTDHFAKIIYVIGHGSSSANNTHYAAYDCGACSGRPGSVNARVFCHMANHPKVRARLEEKGFSIPKDSHFMGGLHDTANDEIEYYDETLLPWQHIDEHLRNQFIFKKALAHNARERARRFVTIDQNWSLEKINRKMKLRSVSLFEPRPELNHATNSLCVVGRRSLTKELFLDRRCFMNSYDYRQDPDGTYLLRLMKPIAPVCGGINLEYFFSRVDNQKLGAGSKLPHNVMGLIGVANGIEGDLRPGLPSQMIELHDPLRLLVVVEHFPEVLLGVLKTSPETYEWFANEWIHLAVIHPETREALVFKNETFVPYKALIHKTPLVKQLNELFKSRENIPVHVLQ